MRTPSLRERLHVLRSIVREATEGESSKRAAKAEAAKNYHDAVERAETASKAAEASPSAGAHAAAVEARKAAIHATGKAYFARVRGVDELSDRPHYEALRGHEVKMKAHEKREREAREGEASAKDLGRRLTLARHHEAEMGKSLSGEAARSGTGRMGPGHFERAAGARSAVQAADHYRAAHRIAPDQGHDRSADRVLKLGNVSDHYTQDAGGNFKQR